LDNKLLDVFYKGDSADSFIQSQDVLESDEFVFYLKQTEKSLDYLMGLSFAKFWAHISQMSEILGFLDEFLARFRKGHDPLKLFMAKSHQKAQEEGNEVRVHTNRVLRLVF
jgi:hypothetical protein